MIEVQTPDGSIIEFPDGTDNGTIKNVMTRYGTQGARPPSVLDTVAPGSSAAVDYSTMPIEQLRTQVANLDPASRDKVLNAWADAQEQKQNEEAKKGFFSGSLRSLDDTVRTVARGTTPGTWADEANAATSAALGGNSYAEEKALQNARDRRIQRDNPGASFVGNIIGAGLETAVSPATGLPRLIGRAAVQGAGEGDTLSDRAKNSAISAGITGAVGYGLNKAAQWYRNYSTPSQAVEDAATQLTGNNRTPYFVKAESPQVQAGGRQMAQTTPGSPLAQNYQATRQGLNDAANAAVVRETGAPAATAPSYAGTRVQSGMQTAAQDATGQINQISRDIEQLVPAGARSDTPALRGATQNIIDQRVASGYTPRTAEQGLDRTLNITTNPEGVTWPGLQKYASDLGEDIGRPSLVPRDVTGTEMSTLYRATREADQPNFIRRFAGEPGVEQWRQGVEIQNQLAGLRDRVAQAVGTKQPEQLIKLAYDAATLKGGGTQLQQLDLIRRSLNPEQQRQLGAGVFAIIQNEAKGVPGGLAARIEAIPAEARAMLWPANTPLGQTVEQARVLAGRLGQVDNLAHRGSAATLGETMKGALPMIGGLSIPGYFAHAAGVLPEYLAAAGGASYLANKFAKPFLYQHGLPQMNTQTINDVARLIGQVGSREAAQQRPRSMMYGR